VLVGIRPEDVMLFEAWAETPVSSARNQLLMRVESIEHMGSTDRVSLHSNGMRIASSISRASSRELDLTVGAEVRAFFKATSVWVQSAAGVPSGV